MPDLRSRVQLAYMQHLKPVDEAYLSDIVLERAQEKGIKLPLMSVTYIMQRARRDLTLLAWLDKLEEQIRHQSAITAYGQRNFSPQCYIDWHKHLKL